MPPDPVGPIDCGAAVIAQETFTGLTADHTFTLPTVNLATAPYLLPAQTGELYDPVVKLTNNNMTTGVINGNGTFDILMSSISAHLKGEFDKQRITGDQYAKAYIELTTAALGTSAQYLLGRDQAYWSAVLVQTQARRAEIDAVVAGVQLETSKAQLQIAFYEAYRSEADYALSKMKLATEDAQFCSIKVQTETARYNLTTMLPEQFIQLEYTTDSMLPAQLASIQADTAIKSYQRDSLMPQELAGMVSDKAVVDYQVASLMPAQLANTQSDTSVKAYQVSDILPMTRAGIVADTSIKDYQVDTFLPTQVAGLVIDNSTKTYTLDEFMPEQRDGIIADTGIKEYTLSDMLPQQKLLITEQAQVQRAQTMNTRVDGTTTVVGAVGKQKELYDQQIDSYVKDAQYKVAKMVLDSWITRKTLDDAVTVPNQFNSTEIDEIMILLRANNSLGS